MMPSAYSDEAIEEIRLLLLDGLSAAQIGIATKRSRNAIIGIVKRNKVLNAVGFQNKKQGKKGKPRAPRVPALKAIAKVDNPVGAKRIAFRPGRVMKVVPIAIPSRNIRLVDLTPFQCRYATNDAEPREEHLFCGNKTMPGSAWCEAHHRIVYPSKVKEAAA